MLVSGATGASSIAILRVAGADPTSLGLMLGALGCIAVIVAALRALVVVHAPRHPRPTRRSAEGTATIEFALITPILLFVILILAQTMLLMGGNLFIHYASFAAARAAVVQIPRNTPDAATNRYRAGTDKHEAIRRAAVYALLPVAGRASPDAAGSIPQATIVDGFERFYQRYGQEPPPWVDGLLPGRIAYADRHTKVRLEEPVTPDAETLRFEPTDGRFGARDPVTVRVRHRFALAVPFISRIFADGRTDAGRYMTLAARTTLTNEGLRPDLPPAPELPRRP